MASQNVRPDHIKFDDDDSIFRINTNVSNGIERVTTFGKTYWKNIIIITFIAYTSVIPESTVFPIEWAYLQISDSNADEAFYGYLASVNALGQVISSALSGYVTNKIQQVKGPIVFGYILALLSCCIYLCIEFIPYKRRFVFLIFEFIMGISVGSIKMYRVHIAMGVDDNKKPKAFAITLIANVFALISGPIFQFIFSLIFKYPGISIFGGLHLNIFTIPGYFTFFFSAISLIVMIFWFSSGDTMKNSEAIIIHKKINEIQMEDLDNISIGNGESLCDTIRKRKKCVKQQLKIDYLAVAVCFLIKIVISTTTILLRTTMIPYMQTLFAFNAKQLVKYTTIIQIIMAILSLGCYMIYFLFKVGDRYKERSTFIFGFSMIIVYYLITYPWNFYEYTIRENLDKNLEIDSRINLNSTDLCKYSWCLTTYTVNGWIFFTTTIIAIGISTPLIFINLEILYSKLLKNIKQGTMQGIFMAVGNILAIICPLIYNKIYESSGPKTIWIIQIFLNLFTLGTIFIYYNRLSLSVPKIIHSNY
uniref:MFS domain-containing protein n=1 Tax=Parastrongyloides trichosuri TaxID=131310 RepID=A0A0N4ZRH5_PARTI